MIARGDIRWSSFDRPDKRRPVLVVANALALPSLAQVAVIPLSTNARLLPWEVTLTEADGVPSRSVLTPEWIRAVPREDLGARIAGLPDARWSEVREALLRVLGL